MSISRLYISLFLLSSTVLNVCADGGYRLWLKYDKIKDVSTRDSYTKAIPFIACSDTSQIGKTASTELQIGLEGLLGGKIPIVKNLVVGKSGIRIEILPQSFSTGQDRNAIGKIINLMMRSREIYVNYNTPLGLTRPWTGAHYAPEPWQNRSSRPDWTAGYYHRADSLGIGFDRTATGSNALSEYQPQVRKQRENAETCPLPYLIWFHHIRWDQKLSSGKTLWNELCTRFYTGADSVRWMQNEWASVKNAVDPEIHANVTSRLAKQQKEAIWWRDAWVLYLQTFSKQPVPAPFQQPEMTVEEVKQSVNVYLLR
ncbi:alpha-glucuronidase family glycosyl hydrolase [Dyadobacter arcticus]|uniref:Alpha-glucuronidase n=1 Tax=Dyadobacter arcticus TaxID=1078754 RepID=A0ABX0UID4_9BACT|nr:alpha-glucuronidase family glycosyl hydrolase [Dyadobacter arcticus]NIJ52773.1 alpha-glucuronidase [Dyadobacter arcticus]